MMKILTLVSDGNYASEIHSGSQVQISITDDIGQHARLHSREQEQANALQEGGDVIAETRSSEAKKRGPRGKYRKYNRHQAQCLLTGFFDEGLSAFEAGARIGMPDSTSRAYLSDTCMVKMAILLNQKSEASILRSSHSLLMSTLLRYWTISMMLLQRNFQTSLYPYGA